MSSEYYDAIRIFSKNLKALMDKNGKTQVDLIRDLGVTRSAISTWVNGTRLPRLDKVDMLAQYFGCTRSDLIEEPSEFTSSFDNIRSISKKRLPMLGSVACGKPIYMIEDRESYVEAGTDIKADFCLRAKGDSMINAKINDGDIIFVRSQDMVENGEIAVVAIGEEATLKRVYYYPNEQRLILQAENPAYAPQIYVGEELEQVHILGKAIALQTDVR